MEKGWGWFIVIFVIVFLFAGVFAYSNLNEKISNLYNNKIFSENSAKITNSTILVLVKTNNVNINQQTSGAIYVDEEGQSWIKGTAFSIGDGYFLTASHVFTTDNLADIKLIWNGKSYDNAILNFANSPMIDFLIFKSNIDVPKIKAIKDNRATIGQKIGFVGFPLNEKNPILTDGVISSVKEGGFGAFGYTINSFVNRGNSGGPVFLSDTGELIGIISSRQNEGIQVPKVDETKLTEGEKQLYGVLVFMSVQQASNSQVGIGNILGVNEECINSIKTKYEQGTLLQAKSFC